MSNFSFFRRKFFGQIELGFHNVRIIYWNTCWIEACNSKIELQRLIASENLEKIFIKAYLFVSVHLLIFPIRCSHLRANVICSFSRGVRFIKLVEIYVPLSVAHSTRYPHSRSEILPPWNVRVKNVLLFTAEIHSCLTPSLLAASENADAREHLGSGTTCLNNKSKRGGSCSRWEI